MMAWGVLLAGLARAQAPELDSIYLVMVDRFYSGRGDADGQVDRNDPAAFHGGDLAGLTEKLEVIEALGVDTLWLTPIADMREEPIGEHGAFHGYWPNNGRKLSARFGSLEDLEALREETEARGIKLILDAVLNHVGPDTTITQLHPSWFHGRGDITDWSDPVQRRSHDVHGLPDLDHDHPEVVKHLQSDGRFWLTTARPDGFRVDAVSHIEPTFLKAWIAHLTGATDRPLIFAGEVFDGNAVTIAREVAQTGLTHSFDFPLYYAITESICGGGDLRKIAAVLTQDRRYPSGHEWITFLDNHDTPRVQTVCGEQTQAAFTLMTSLRGIPSITWGTESGLTGRTEAEARASMDFSHLPHQEWIARLLDDRRAYSPLIEGSTDLLRVTKDQLVLARVSAQAAVVVAVDTPSQPVLPVEAGEAVWIPITEEGRVRRWLLTPPPGQTFLAWTERIEREQSETAPVTVELPAGDFLIGSDPAVGAWAPDAVATPGPATVALPRGGVVALKTFKRDPDGALVWSNDPDQYVDVEDALVRDEPIRLGR